MIAAILKVPESNNLLQHLPEHALLIKKCTVVDPGFSSARFTESFPPLGFHKIRLFVYIRRITSNDTVLRYSIMTCSYLTDHMQKMFFRHLNPSS